MYTYITKALYMHGLKGSIHRHHGSQPERGNEAMGIVLLHKYIGVYRLNFKHVN